MKSTQYLCKSHIKKSHIKSQLCKSQNHVENHNFASLKITQKSQLFTSEHKNFSKTKRTILEKEPQIKQIGVLKTSVSFPICGPTVPYLVKTITLYC